MKSPQERMWQERVVSPLIHAWQIVVRYPEQDSSLEPVRSQLDEAQQGELGYERTFPAEIPRVRHVGNRIESAQAAVAAASRVGDDIPAQVEAAKESSTLVYHGLKVE